MERAYLLIASQTLRTSGLIQQAEDHLALSQQYFVTEQSHGSALIQTELEWAQLEAGRGQLRQAEQRIERTIADVRRSGDASHLTTKPSCTGEL